jgi:hypothetical protein
MIRTNEWRVENGAFIGQVLVEAEPIQEAGKMARKGGDAWISYAQDLRVINGIKQRKPEDDGNCCLYHNDSFVATVNCSFKDLLPFWVDVRNLYDDPAYHYPERGVIKKLV